MPQAVPAALAIAGAAGGAGAFGASLATAFAIGGAVSSFVASSIIQSRARAKAERRARRAAKDAAGIDARASANAGPINVAYGRFGVYQGTAFFANGRSSQGYANAIVEGGGRRNDETASVTLESTMRDGIGYINADNVEAEYNQYMMVMRVTCLGQINKYVRFMIDDVPCPGGQLDGTYITEYSSLTYNGVDYMDTPSPMALSWVPGGTGDSNPYPRIDDSARFTDISYTTSIHFLGETRSGKQPQYSAIPASFAQGEGRLVRDIDENAVGAHVIDDDRAYNNNAGLVFLDYVNSDIYGPNQPLEEIDLSTVYRAKEYWETQEFPSPTPDAKLDPEAVREAGGDPDTEDTPENWCVAHGYGPRCEGIQWPGGFYRGSLAFRGTDRANRERAYGGAVHVKRGEYNGMVPTVLNYASVMDQILAVVPGSFWTLGLDGKYKLTFGDHRVDGETASVAEFFETDCVEGSGINELARNFEDRINQLKVHFADQESDFAENTATFPIEDSTIHRRYMSEDGGQRLREDIGIDGISSLQQAQAVARMEVALSRRSLFEWKTSRKFLHLEVGDIVTLNVHGRGRVHARIEVVAVEEMLNITFHSQRVCQV